MVSCILVAYFFPPQAHATTPYLANGANQALEVATSVLYMFGYGPLTSIIQDAYILGRVLGAPSITRSTISAALTAYDVVRRPHAQAVVRASRANGRLGDWIYVPPGQKEPLKDEEHIKQEMILVSSWVSKGDIEDQVAQAMSTLEENLAAV